MFENISFLFSFSLAIMAWSVICYWKAIEQNKRAADDYSVDIYTEYQNMAERSHYCSKNLTENESENSRLYNATINLVAVSIGAYALSKIFKWLEKQTIFYSSMPTNQEPLNNLSVISDLHLPPIDDKHLVEAKVGDDSQLAADQNIDLIEQLNALENRCIQMQNLLMEMRCERGNLHSTPSSSNATNSSTTDISFFKSANKYSNSHNPESSEECSSEDTMMTLWADRTCLKLSQSETSLPQSRCHSFDSAAQGVQNVYICNSQIHINGTIYLSPNMKKNLQSQSLMYSQTQSEFLQVWGKFLTGPNQRPVITHINNVLI